MEVELINAYVEKQRDTINDLMAKNVLLEAKSIVSEKHLQKALETNEKIAQVETKCKMLQDQNTTMAELVEKLKQDILHLHSEKEGFNNLLQEAKQNAIALVNQLEEEKKLSNSLKVEVNRLTVEKESQKAKAERLKKRAQDLISD